MRRNGVRVEVWVFDLRSWWMVVSFIRSGSSGGGVRLGVMFSF